jgi:eukaryotic-like serine/threonine-protein kinase
VSDATTINEGHLIGNRYRLTSRIARGGMAEVWEATDEVLSRPVAVKLLLPHLAADAAFHARFHREAMAAARLSHPHIVSIYDTCSTTETEAIVMELVRGTTLRELLDAKGSLPPSRAVAIARQVADALAHAHQSGLVHRDVKPGNILLADDGRVLVTDFGIAKAAEAASDLTDAGQIVGTAKYLSPEQVQGKPLDGRSDVYALGVVLYEMLCGRPPFAAETSTATALARLTSEPLRPRQIRAGLSREVEDLVLRTMAREPDARFASASALCSALDALDLRRVVDDDPVDATIGFAPGADDTPVPTSTGSAPRFQDTERAWLVPAALIVVIALTLLIVGIALRGNDVGRAIFDVANGPDRDRGGEPLALAGAPQSFDPSGSGGEHDDELGLAADGDIGTAWTTERYNSAAFGELKDGVGIVLPLADVAALGALEVASPTSGWSAAVYVSESPGSTLGDWGAPVATVDDVRNATTFDLGGARGRAVLLWITDLGDGTVGDRWSTAIAEVRVLSA